MRFTIGLAVYFITLPLTIVAATIVLADRIFHYVVDRGHFLITGYQNKGSDEFYLGLPDDVTVEPG